MNSSPGFPLLSKLDRTIDWCKGLSMELGYGLTGEEPDSRITRFKVQRAARVLNLEDPGDIRNRIEQAVEEVTKLDREHYLLIDEVTNAILTASYEKLYDFVSARIRISVFGLTELAYYCTVIYNQTAIMEEYSSELVQKMEVLHQRLLDIPINGRKMGNMEEYFSERAQRKKVVEQRLLDNPVTDDQASSTKEFNIDDLDQRIKVIEQRILDIPVTDDQASSTKEFNIDDFDQRIDVIEQRILDITLTADILTELAHIYKQLLVIKTSLKLAFIYPNMNSIVYGAPQLLDRILAFSDLLDEA